MTLFRERKRDMNYLFLIIVIAAVLAVLAIAAFTNFELDNEHYDRLKQVVIKWSYITVFIGVIAKTFNVAYGTETVTVVAAIGAMLAGLLDISTDNHNKTMEMDVRGLQYLDDEYKDDEGVETDE
jgi:Kef-type K+ transport system membrane component KefB